MGSWTQSARQVPLRGIQSCREGAFSSGETLVGGFAPPAIFRRDRPYIERVGGFGILPVRELPLQGREQPNGRHTIGH